MVDLIREGVTSLIHRPLMSSQAIGPQKGVPDDNSREYSVEISGFLMTRKPKSQREKKSRTPALSLLPYRHTLNDIRTSY